MSRIKIFSMLFLTLVLGTIASVFLYQQWLRSYEKTVLKPSILNDQKVSQAAIQLFASQKMNDASLDVMRSSRLAAAFGQSDAKKRHDSTYDELNVLKAKKGFRAAAFLVATDTKGKAFANAAAINWKKDWSALKLIKQAAKGQVAHGFEMFAKKTHLYLAIPIFGMPGGSVASTNQDDQNQAGSKDDKVEPRKKAPASRKKVPAKKKRKCRAGTYLYCYQKCLKRKKRAKGKKRGRCLKWTKRCYCRRKKKKKTGFLLKNRSSRLAQKAPDDRSTDDSMPAVKPKIKVAKAKEVLGVLVFGFALNQSLAKAIKAQTGLDLAFFSLPNLFNGGTLSEEISTKLKAMLKGKSASATSILARKGETPFYVELGEKQVLLGLSSSLGKKSGVIFLRPVTSVYGMFRQYNMMIFIVIGIAFLLALILLLLGSSGVQKHLEKLEETVLDSYNTGKLNVAFNEKAPWVLGSLAATLNLFYRQLREGAEEAVSQSSGVTWDKEPVAEVTPDYAQTIESSNVPVVAPEVTTPTPEEDHSGTEQKEKPSTNEMIGDFLDNPSSHYEEVFVKYYDAKKEVGEDVSRLKKDKFVEKLRRNAADYVENYDCKGVLFDVIVKDDKVILKPQLIPKD